MQRPDRSVYTAQDFLQWRATKSLILTPKFQRRPVWKPAARSYFIDTLLREMPIPPIYIRIVQARDTGGIVREVVDGQQRVASVLDFVDGKYRLSRTLNGPWAGKTFDSLANAEKNRLKAYGFSAEVFSGLSDLVVLEIFARLNTYAVPLNSQELRNGRFFGIFKQSAYSLAHEHLEFWRKHEIFTERNIARMLEVELTSELMIVEIDGMQDKKKSIDRFYDDYDDAFSIRKRVERQFREVIDTISEVFEDTLVDTEFNRAPLFYTLFCAIYHRQFGLSGFNLHSPERRLPRAERLSLAEAAEKLSTLIESGREGEDIPARYVSFVAACLRQTDNIRPRTERLKVLYEHAFT
jgi:hypothetical protein